MLHTYTIGTPLLYTVFSISVLIMIAIDMFALKHTGDHKVSIKEALMWCIVWITVALVFNFWLYWHLLNVPLHESVTQIQQADFALDKALEFLTGYVIEKALSIDNIFVFLLIFNFFKIPPKYQRRVLVYGVLAAILLRIIMVLVGAALITQFEWILYIFGAFLVYTGIKMFKKEEESNLEDNVLLKFFRNKLRLTSTLHEEHFFIKENALRYATPLFLVLLMITFSDIIFAVDSVPAIFAITKDPFIVMTSNVFAILGLRAMYFLLADFAERFHLLQYGLAIILTFIGMKMLLIAVDFHVSTLISLGIVIGTLVGAIILSLWIKPKPHS